MKALPKTRHSLVLRSDFSDDDAWRSVCAAIQEPNADGFRAYVECIDDPDYAGLTVEQLVVMAPNDRGQPFVFLVDRLTLTSPEHPVLVVDLCNHPGRTFRVIPREIWGVENNLSIANMDFDEFAERVDSDGIFRGFAEA